jgi:hypothetical protein
MKEKLDYVIKRYSEYLEHLFPKSSPSQWANTISKNVYAVNDFSFEFVYRCYHHSFKVVYMKTPVQQLMDLTVFLFTNIATVKEVKSFEHYIGVPPVISKIATLEYTNAAKLLYKKDSMTFGFVKDILTRKPNKDGLWEDYTKHHLTYMGGVYWSIMTTISLLGVLKAEILNNTKKEYYITYPQGIKNYYTDDLNGGLLLQKSFKRSIT